MHALCGGTRRISANSGASRESARCECDRNSACSSCSALCILHRALHLAAYPAVDVVVVVVCCCQEIADTMTLAVRVVGLVSRLM